VGTEPARLVPPSHVTRIATLILALVVLALALSAGGEATRSADKSVLLAFGGDVHFEGVIESELRINPRRVLASIGPVLRRADIAVVNLETAVTDRGTAASKEYTFRAPPTAFNALAAGGVDVASMANNHGLDYGEVGLRDSLAAAKRSRFRSLESASTTHRRIARIARR
jgi:Bacterial capsule synthesis protein PGA_cap